MATVWAVHEGCCFFSFFFKLYVRKASAPHATVIWMLLVMGEDANTCINLSVKVGWTPSSQLISANACTIKARSVAPGRYGNRWPPQKESMCVVNEHCCWTSLLVMKENLLCVCVRWLTSPRSGRTRTGGPGAARRPRLVLTWTWTSSRNTCRSTPWRSSLHTCPHLLQQTWGSWYIPTRAPGSQVSPAGNERMAWWRFPLMHLVWCVSCSEQLVGPASIQVALWLPCSTRGVWRWSSSSWMVQSAWQAVGEFNQTLKNKPLRL